MFHALGLDNWPRAAARIKKKPQFAVAFVYLTAIKCYKSMRYKVQVNVKALSVFDKSGNFFALTRFEILLVSGILLRDLSTGAVTFCANY